MLAYPEGVEPQVVDRLLSMLGSGTVCRKSVVLSLRERRFRLAERDDYTKLPHYGMLCALADVP